MAHTPGTTGSALQQYDQLTARDRTLLDVLAEHRVLTTDQITRLAFPSRDRAERRTLQLARRNILARFRRMVRPGSQTWRYTLGHGGAAIIAAQRGTEAPRPATQRARVLRLAENPHLDHLLGVNDFFVDLAHHARTHQGCGLLRWYSERRATQACGQLAHPDGFATWQADGHTISFFLEHDTGTEPLDRVAAKLAGYRDAATGGGPQHPVLFWLPTAAREAHLRRALGASPPVPVATATAELARAHNANPADALWLTATGSQRSRLAELPTPRSRTKEDIDHFIDNHAA